MNIGIFADAYHPQVSGVVTSIKILKKELESLGHNVYIFTVSHPDANDKPEDNIFRLPSIPFIALPSQRVGSLYSYKLMKTIKDLNLDVIHTQTEFSVGLFGKMAAKKFNIPVVHTYHTMYEDYVHYISRGSMIQYTQELAKKLSRAYCNKCESVIVPTGKVKDVLENYGVDKPINIIPTGMDLDPFDRRNYSDDTINAIKSHYGISNSDPVVLFIGRIAKEKSIDVIIKAMPDLIKKMPDVKLLIVGGGPEEKALKNLADELNISSSVKFTGEKPWAEIGLYYQLGDVFVSASVTETQGLTFSEAMAANLPVIAKYDKNLEDIIVNGENGLVFKQDAELSSLLFELLSCKDTRCHISKNAFDMIEPLSSTYFGKNVESVYLNAIEYGKLSNKRA